MVANLSAPTKILNWLDKVEDKLSAEAKQQLKQDYGNNSSTSSETNPTHIEQSSNYNSSNGGSETSPDPAARAANINSRPAGDTAVEADNLPAAREDSTTRVSGGEYSSGATTTKDGLELRNNSGGETLGAEQSENLASNAQYTPLDFKNPAEMYAFFHPDIAEGRIQFHKWQVEEQLRISEAYDKDNPLKLLLVANNGSGKDSYIIAPAAVWLAACKIRHKVVITSKSAKQIETQTEPYIRSYCQKVNEQLGMRVFEIKQRVITCTITGSAIIIFVSDEPENVEGQHPFPDYIGAELTVIINEAKSIDDEMFKAYARFTGYTRWIEISSSGKMSGHFYKVACRAVPYPCAYELGRWFCRKVTIYDCPHISQNQIEDDAIDFGGKETEFFRSKYLSEFTSADGDRIVIPLEKVQDCLKANASGMPKWDKTEDIVAGLDLSGGRDETVLVTRRGNKMLKMSWVKIKDAALLLEYFKNIMFPEHEITKSTKIYADNGGMGEPLIDLMKADGYNVIPVNNQSPASNKRLYKNRGTQNWYNFANAIRFQDIILLNNEKFIEQLTTRGAELPDNEKLALLSKVEEKSMGKESPDRADSAALAFIGYQISPHKRLQEAQREKVKQRGNLTNITQQELLDHMSKGKFKGFEGLNERSNKRQNDTTQMEHIRNIIKQHNASRN